jgi:hypothetical protein
MNNFGLIELIFSGTVVLAFAFYQLWSVNREIAKDKEAAAKKDAAE